MRSNARHLILEKIRILLNSARKSDVLNSNSTSTASSSSGNGGGSGVDRDRGIGVVYENQIISKFRELQTQIRSSSSEDIDPLQVILPFLAILDAHNIAGPFKLACLNAIQSMLVNNVFIVQSEHLQLRTIAAIDLISKFSI